MIHQIIHPQPAVEAPIRRRDPDLAALWRRVKEPQDLNDALISLRFERSSRLEVRVLRQLSESDDSPTVRDFLGRVG